jgi:hypothetical protein
MMSKRWWVRRQEAGMMMLMRMMLGQQETRVRVVPTVSASRPSSGIETELKVGVVSLWEELFRCSAS